MAIRMSIHMSNQMYVAIILLREVLAKKYDADPSAPDSCLAASLAGSWAGYRVEMRVEMNVASSARFLDRPRMRNGNSTTEAGIFKATEKLLAKQSFAELSVAQIIERAGISRASFYHYFSSKLGVIAGLLVAVMDDIFDTASPFLHRPGKTIVESLRVSIQNAMDVWTEHRVLLRVVMENWASSEELEAQWTSVMNRFAEAIAVEIDDERDNGHLPAGLPSSELAAALIWSTERCLYIAGREADGTDFDERARVEVLVTLWAGALQLGQAGES
jgi:AcrR family transcriptional regulator